MMGVVDFQPQAVAAATALGVTVLRHGGVTFRNWRRRFGAGGCVQRGSYRLHTYHDVLSIPMQTDRSLISIYGL